MPLKLTGRVGWAIPQRSNKNHFFMDNQSLCFGHIWAGILEKKPIEKRDKRAITVKTICKQCQERLADAEEVLTKLDEIKKGKNGSA